MADKKLDGLLSSAVAQSVQSVPKDHGGGSIFTIPWMARAGTTIPDWWSPARDLAIRKFWKASDHLSGAIYTMEAKMASIDFSVQARDQSNKEHVAQAEEETYKLKNGAEWGLGWPVFYGKGIEELTTQDNGWFFEIIGDGNPAGPIIGAPVTVKNLDAAYCTRTGDPDYPVIYQDILGKRYKLHRSRVGYISMMSSPIQAMFDVGFCAVPRCINTAQTLIDIGVFNQEKMGSRPHRAILITKGGLDPDDVAKAFAMAEASLDAQGLSRYSKSVVLGSTSLQEADLGVVDLASLPDGFDEETSTTLSMAVISLAFGVDARELFPAMQSGATRADALLQHLKQRGKGPGQILQLTESIFNQKYLPPHLKMVFDFQDDEEDRQVADIRKVRAERINILTTSGMFSKRVSREQMFQSGDLSKDQFEQLELEDGRTLDGTPIESLFYSEDDAYKKYLGLGVDDPMDIEGNDQAVITKKINKKLALAKADMINLPTKEGRHIAYQAMMTLKHLLELYNPSPLDMATQPGVPGKPGQPGVRPNNKQAVGTNIEENRRTSQMSPNPKQELSTNMRDIKPNWDDTHKSKSGMEDGESTDPFLRMG